MSPADELATAERAVGAARIEYDVAQSRRAGVTELSRLSMRLVAAEAHRDEVFAEQVASPWDDDTTVLADRDEDVQ